jgi:hypothetical protein
MYPERGRQVLERLTLPVSHRRVGLYETLHKTPDVTRAGRAGGQADRTLK